MRFSQIGRWVLQLDDLRENSRKGDDKVLGFQGVGERK